MTSVQLAASSSNSVNTAGTLNFEAIPCILKNGQGGAPVYGLLVKPIQQTGPVLGTGPVKPADPVLLPAPPPINTGFSNCYQPTSGGGVLPPIQQLSPSAGRNAIIFNNLPNDKLPGNASFNATVASDASFSSNENSGTFQSRRNPQQPFAFSSAGMVCAQDFGGPGSSADLSNCFNQRPLAPSTHQNPTGLVLAHEPGSHHQQQLSVDHLHDESLAAFSDIFGSYDLNPAEQQRHQTTLEHHHGSAGDGSGFGRGEMTTICFDQSGVGQVGSNFGSLSTIQQDLSRSTNMYPQPPQQPSLNNNYAPAPTQQLSANNCYQTGNNVNSFNDSRLGSTGTRSNSNINNGNNNFSSASCSAQQQAGCSGASSDSYGGVYWSSPGVVNPNVNKSLLNQQQQQPQVYPDLQLLPSLDVNYGQMFHGNGVGVVPMVGQQQEWVNDFSSSGSPDSGIQSSTGSPPSQCVSPASVPPPSLTSSQQMPSTSSAATATATDLFVTYRPNLDYNAGAGASLPRIDLPGRSCNNTFTGFLSSASTATTSMANEFRCSSNSGGGWSFNTLAFGAPAFSNTTAHPHVSATVGNSANPVTIFEDLSSSSATSLQQPEVASIDNDDDSDDNDFSDMPVLLPECSPDRVVQRKQQSQPPPTSSNNCDFAARDPCSLSHHQRSAVTSVESTCSQRTVMETNSVSRSFNEPLSVAVEDNGFLQSKVAALGKTFDNLRCSHFNSTVSLLKTNETQHSEQTQSSWQRRTSPVSPCHPKSQEPHPPTTAALAQNCQPPQTMNVPEAGLLVPVPRASAALTACSPTSGVQHTPCNPDNLKSATSKDYPSTAPVFTLLSGGCGSSTTFSPEKDVVFPTISSGTSSTLDVPVKSLQSPAFVSDTPLVPSKFRTRATSNDMLKQRVNSRASTTESCSVNKTLSIRDMQIYSKLREYRKRLKSSLEKPTQSAPITELEQLCDKLTQQHAPENQPENPFRRKLFFSTCKSDDCGQLQTAVKSVATNKDCQKTRNVASLESDSKSPLSEHQNLTKSSSRPSLLNLEEEASESDDDLYKPTTSSCGLSSSHTRRPRMSSVKRGGSDMDKKTKSPLRSNSNAQKQQSLFDTAVAGPAKTGENRLQQVEEAMTSCDLCNGKCIAATTCFVDTAGLFVEAVNIALIQRLAAQFLVRHRQRHENFQLDLQQAQQRNKPLRSGRNKQQQSRPLCKSSCPVCKLKWLWQVTVDSICPWPLLTKAHFSSAISTLELTRTNIFYLRQLTFPLDILYMHRHLTNYFPCLGHVAFSSDPVWFQRCRACRFLCVTDVNGRWSSGQRKPDGLFLCYQCCCGPPLCFLIEAPQLAAVKIKASGSAAKIKGDRGSKKRKRAPSKQDSSFRGRRHKSKHQRIRKATFCSCCNMETCNNNLSVNTSSVVTSPLKLQLRSEHCTSPPPLGKAHSPGSPISLWSTKRINSRYLSRMRNFELPQKLIDSTTSLRQEFSDRYKKIRTNIYVDTKLSAVPLVPSPIACSCKVSAVSDSVSRPTKDDSQVSGCKEDCLNRMMFTECSPAQCPVKDRCSNQCFQKHSWIKGLEKIDTGQKRGIGLRTTVPIAQGEFICEYVGEVVNADTFRWRMQHWYGKATHHYALNLNSGTVIDAYKSGNVARFINHSCQPNCEMQKWQVNGQYRMGVFALRDIKPGEELTYNYNFQSFNIQQECFCGQSACCGFLGRSQCAKDLNSKAVRSAEQYEVASLQNSKLLETMAASYAPPIVALRQVFLKRTLTKTHQRVAEKPPEGAGVLVLFRRNGLKREKLVQRANDRSTKRPVLDKICERLQTKQLPQQNTNKSPGKKRQRLGDRPLLKKFETRSQDHAKGTVERLRLKIEPLASLKPDRRAGHVVKTAAVNSSKEQPTMQTKELAICLKRIRLQKEQQKEEAKPADSVPPQEQAAIPTLSVQVLRLTEENIFDQLHNVLLLNTTPVPDLSPLPSACSSLMLPTNEDCCKEGFVDTGYNPDDDTGVWQEPATENNVEDNVRCICGIPEDDGLMLQCEKCLYWLHAVCGGERASTEDSYFCDRCLDPEGYLAKKGSVLLQPPPAVRFPDCTYYRSLMKEGLQLRIGECIYVKKILNDVHKKKLQSLNQDCVRQNETLLSATNLKQSTKNNHKNNGTNSSTDGAISQNTNCIYLSSDAGMPDYSARFINHNDLRIFRIERLFEAPRGDRFVFGSYFARPSETFCEPSRRFYKNELFCTPLYDTLPLDAVVARCLILDPVVFCKGRPVLPKYREEDVYVCEFRVDRTRRLFERLKHKSTICQKSYIFKKFEMPLKVKRDFTPFDTVGLCLSRSESRSAKSVADNEKPGVVSNTLSQQQQQQSQQRAPNTVPTITLKVPSSLGDRKHSLSMEKLPKKKRKVVEADLTRTLKTQSS